MSKLKPHWTKEQQQAYYKSHKIEGRAAHRRQEGCVNPSGETKIGACEICERVCKLVYDHDHINGKFRGWLCRQCNTGLGHFQDTVEILDRAIQYLLAHPTYPR